MGVNESAVGNCSKSRIPAAKPSKCWAQTGLSEQSLKAGCNLALFISLAILFTSRGQAEEPGRGRSDGRTHPESLPLGAVTRIGATKFRHKDSINCVSFSPSGKILATGSNDRSIRLWDERTGKELLRLTQPDPVACLAFSPDGKGIASDLAFRNIAFWDIGSGKIIRQFIGHQGQVVSIAFSPDGLLLASGSRDKTVRLWEIATGKELHRLEGHRQTVRTVAFSPGGKTMASGSTDGMICFWKVKSEKEVRKVVIASTTPGTSRDPSGVNAVSFSSDGRTLASGDETGRIRIYDADTGNLRQSLPGSGLPIRSVTFSPDAQLIVFADDAAIRTWDISKGCEIRPAKRFPGAASLSISPNGKTLAAVGSCLTLRLWDMGSGKERPRQPAHDGSCVNAIFACGSRFMVTRGENGDTRVWNLKTSEQLFELQPDGKGDTSCHSLSIGSDESTLALAESSASIGFWDLRTGKKLGSWRLGRVGFPSLTGSAPRLGETLKPVLKSFALSPDGASIAVEVQERDDVKNHIIQLWDLESHRFRIAVKVPIVFGPISGKGPENIAFLVGGETFASAGRSNVIRLWEIATGKEVRQFRGHEAMVSCLACSPDGRLLVSGSNGRPSYGSISGKRRDDGIRFWDVANGKLLLSLKSSDTFLTGIVALAFAPDGRTFASGGLDETIRLWEVVTGQEIHRFQDPGSKPVSIAFSPDGQALGSAMSDGNALIWNLDPSGWSRGKEKRAFEIGRLWSDLASDDASKGYRAVWTLAISPKEALALIKNRIKPFPSVRRDRVKRLIAQLDDDNFDTREAASKELARLGSQAAPALRQALPVTDSEEARRRIKALLESLDTWLVKDPEMIRSLRSVWILQRIGTLEARVILQDLASGAPSDRLTQEAKAALAILSQQHSR